MISARFLLLLLLQSKLLLRALGRQLRFLRENAPLHFRVVGKGGLDRPSEFYRSINPISAGEQILLVFPLDFRSTYGPD